MKKLILLTTALLLTACNPSKPASTPNQPQSQAEAVEEMSNLAQDIQQGKSVQCILTQKDTNQTMTYYMKQNKIKITNFINPDPTPQSDNYGSLISDGQFSYMWSNETKQGLKMPTPQNESSTDSNDQTDEVPDISKEEYQRQYKDMGYTIQCDPKEIQDSEFIPPADIKFTDMSQFINELPGQMSPEQLDQMQKNLEQFNQ